MFSVVVLHRQLASFSCQINTHISQRRPSSRHAGDGGRRPSHVNKQMHCGWSVAAHDGLHQRDVRPRWRREAGGSSCFHPNLVPHDYSQFHSRWFFTETDGGSQMPKYRWERSEVGGESWEGEGWEASPLTPLHHRGLGDAPPWVWAAAGWWGMKGAAVDVAVGAAVRLCVDPAVARRLPWSLYTPKDSIHTGEHISWSSNEKWRHTAEYWTL